MNSFTTEDLQVLAKFPFTDPRWKTKFLIGGLLHLAGYIIPFIPIMFVYGYCAQMMRQIIVEKRDPFMPEWDNWEKFLQDGLKITGVTLIYSLPGLIFFCGGYGLFAATIIGAGAASENLSRDSAPLTALVPLLGMASWLGGFGLGMVLMLVGLAFLPVAVGHVIATDQFSAAFRVREWWSIFRANLSGYVITYVLMFGFWMALSFAIQILYFTVIFCCLLPFVMAPVMMYTMIIASVLFAQAYQVGAQKLALLATTA
ncbi:MAG: hypothetical protein DPW09_28830 [Anaerolineae bacterium]|nr:DUF4013 domain-containing protein [Anaerolineales bacterium]MCQ3977453.1 hypothetical protein [Anaerolineae bacterium]